ncbi:MAG: copper-translocating P-type ATPase [Phycisphaerae bacterium]|nr:MAG: copper-translocating P-type ATPase [Phycisphaerae bacterium]
MPPEQAVTPCTHCGTPTPSVGVALGIHVFCCRGCEAAYALITTCGLDRFYALRNAADTRPVTNAPHDFAAFDTEDFRRRHVRTVAPGALEADFLIASMHCGGCVYLLERLPRLVPGVEEARVNLHRGVLRVRWRDDAVALSAIARVLDALGYTPRPPDPTARHAARTQDERRELVRLGVAAACAGNAMIYAVALYAGAFEGIDHAHATLFRYLSLAVTAVALAWPGRVFFRNAWAALRTRTPHLDLPITLALVAGAVWSVISTLRGEGEVYFDSLSVLVFVLLAGRLLQRRRQQAGSDAVESLFSLTPPSARKATPEGLAVVSADSLVAGDEVEVRAGDSFPADGLILAGSSAVDQSLMTGESRPAQVARGDAVLAGTVNLTDAVRVRVERSGEATRLAGLVRLLEDAARRKAPIVLLADRLTGIFMVGMLSLAALAAGAYLFIDPARAVERAVALLVVTCPCALGLATPLTLTVALGRAARRGLLIKGADTLEHVANARTILLDKTGTITLGRPTVVRWVGDESLRPAVASLESRLAHPIARALCEGITVPPHLRDAADVHHTTGGGCRGVVGGHALIVGSPAFVRGSTRHTDTPCARALLAEAAKAAREGLTPVLIAAADEPAALALLGDAVRPDAAVAVQTLHQLGFTVGILSGDHPEVVATVARVVGIDPALARGGLSPEQKLAYVRARAADEAVIFVGDGVNDAAALAAAQVGVAVHGGAEAALAAADVYASKPGLSPLVDLIEGGRLTMRTIRRNLAASFIYNILAVIGTLAGFITPLLAALIMPMSSITVLSIALRGAAFTDRVRRPATRTEPTPKGGPAWA